MKHLISILIALSASTLVPVAAEAADITSTRVTTDRVTPIPYIKKARHLIDAKGDYVNAKINIEKALAIAPENYEALQILEEINGYLEEQRRIEREAYNSACSQGTVEALREFTENYPKSELVTEANNRIKDMTYWNSAQSANTIASYENYLTMSPLCAFRQEAESRIVNLKADARWKEIRNTDDIEVLRVFNNTYPNSKYRAEANKRINLLDGVNECNKGNYEYAFQLLTKAKSDGVLSSNYQSYYDKCLEEHNYREAISTQSQESLYSFLSTYPSSVHASEVSNAYAIKLAQGLSSVSTDTQYERCLSYCKDALTTSKVNEYISASKKARRRLKRSMRADAIRDWWKGRIGVGWQVFTIDANDHDLDYGSGLTLRFGRFNDAVNILGGVAYNHNSWVDWGDKDEKPESFNICGQVVFPVGIRFNMGPSLSEKKFTIGCMAEFGKRVYKSSDTDLDVNKNSLAIIPQLGLTSRHLEWCLYFKYYLKDKGLINDKYIYYSGEDYNVRNYRIGTHITWFF